MLIMVEHIRTHFMNKMIYDHLRLAGYIGPITPRPQSRLEAIESCVGIGLLFGMMMLKGSLKQYILQRGVR